MELGLVMDGSVPFRVKTAYTRRGVDRLMNILLTTTTTITSRQLFDKIC